MVDNLINNAVKYSPRGSADHGGDPRGRASSRASPSRDNGPGIPDNERHKLFKDYGRLSAQPTGGEKSTGLGLAICRKIVEAHNGTIGVENIAGRGCEFVVSLPTLQMNFSGSILLVDDEAHIRKFISLLLRHLGVKRIFEAKNGTEALEVYQREKAGPDTARRATCP